jgi:hypothetical protein
MAIFVNISVYDAIVPANRSLVDILNKIAYVHQYQNRHSHIMAVYSLEEVWLRLGTQRSVVTRLRLDSLVYLRYGCLQLLRKSRCLFRYTITFCSLTIVFLSYCYIGLLGWATVDGWDVYLLVAIGSYSSISAILVANPHILVYCLTVNNLDC